jgi:sugar phosphate isomerase/epimerase
MRLGISSYTYVWSIGVPGFPQPARPLTAIELVDRADEMGVYVVQIADNLPLDRLTARELDTLRNYARERGVGLEVGTWGIKPEQLLTYLEIAKRLQSPIVRTVIGSEGGGPGLDHHVLAIKSVLPEYEQTGVVLAIENHDELYTDDLAWIVEQCDSPSVGICFDTANSLGLGEDLRTVLSSLGPSVQNIHFKDYVAHRLPHKKGFIIEGCPAGKGLVNILDLMRHLGESSVRASIIVELWPPPEATIEESIAKEEAWARESVQYLRQYIVA